MDGLAKDIAMQYMHTRQKLKFTSTSLGFGTVRCNGVIIGSRLQQSLYYSILDTQLVKRLSILLHIPQAFLINNIHKQVLTTARKEARLATKIFISKWISKDTATGITMVQRKKRLTSNCPLCNIPEEDTIHVLQCPSPSSILQRNSLMEELECWLKGKDTHPDITTFIISGLTKWFNGSNHILSESIPDQTLLIAFQTQLKLGWEAFLYGLIASPIISCQQEYYKSIASWKTGMRWGIQLVDKLWNIIYQLWTHRNNCLHETEALNQNSGIDQLKLAIVHEHALGLLDLPTVYRPYFTSLPTLLSKATKHQKQWFLVIRAGRESCSTFQHYDNFSTEASLRSWIGLAPLS